MQYPCINYQDENDYHMNNYAEIVNKYAMFMQEAIKLAGLRGLAFQGVSRIVFKG
jgi:hypothetical protein